MNLIPLMKAEKKLKILHICESYKPDYGGGAAVYIQDICRHFSNGGHDVRVLCTESKERESYSISTDFDGEIRVDRINLPYFRHRDPEGGKLSSREWKAHESKISDLINNYLDDWMPDIANYHTVRPLGEQCLITLAERSIPVVAFLHDGWLICHRSYFLRSPMNEVCSGPSALKCFECAYSHYDQSRAKSFLKMPWRFFKLGTRPVKRLRRRKLAASEIKGFVGVSDFMARHHEPHLSGIVKHIPLGIDLTGLPAEKPLRPRFPLRFGFIGGSQGHKGLSDILDSAHTLKKEGLSFNISVWGDKADECIAEINERELEDCVKYRGTYTSEQLWEVYNEMDVALMATLVAEPFGRVPLEAAASGAITIAPAVGGITESVRNEIDGLLFKFREQKDLERQMRRILTEKGLYEKLQMNLKPVINTKDSIGNIERFYFEILGEI